VFFGLVFRGVFFRSRVFFFFFGFSSKTLDSAQRKY